MIEVKNKFGINDTIYWVAVIRDQWVVCEGRIARIVFYRWTSMGDSLYYDVVAVTPKGVWGNNSLQLTESSFCTKYRKNAVRKAKQENRKFEERRKKWVKII